MEFFFYMYNLDYLNTFISSVVGSIRVRLAFRPVCSLPHNDAKLLVLLFCQVRTRHALC